MSPFSPLFQIEAPGASSVLVSWDARRRELSAISADAAFRARGGVDVLTPRLRAHFRFAELPRLEVKAFEGASAPEIDPALRRMAEIGLHGKAFEREAYLALCDALPRSRRLLDEAHTRDQARVAEALAGDRALFDIAFHDGQKIRTARVFASSDPELYVFDRSGNATVVSQEALLHELSGLPKTAEWFGPNPKVSGDSADRLIGAIANHPTLGAKLMSGLHRTTAPDAELANRVRNASRTFQESVLANPDPAARDRVYTRMLAAHPDGLRLERSGPASPVHDGPSHVLLAQHTRPAGETITQVKEEWRLDGGVRRTRVVAMEASDVTALFKEKNLDHEGRLNSFAGQPAVVSEREMHDGGEDSKRIKRQWHEAGRLLATQSIGIAHTDEGRLYREEWTDGEGRACKPWPAARMPSPVRRTAERNQTLEL